MTDSDLRDRLVSGERRALAQAITLVESTRADHRERSRRLIADLYTKASSAVRIGLTGTPGVGKSTFIENFGLMLAEDDLKIAVLAVDPSSARTGGSILGDKTRMEKLSRHPSAFIRPSPSKAALGGVARRTREAIILCEAAGYDVILVETVGVGQSETMVSDMTDLFMLLVAPAGGDELQGVKRGIMEIADLVVVNKADGDLLLPARRTAADYAGALRLLRKRPHDPECAPSTLITSALENEGLLEVWRKLREINRWRQNHGFHETNRAKQAVHWMHFELQEGLKYSFAEHPAVAASISQIEIRVANREMVPEAAADMLLKVFRKE